LRVDVIVVVFVLVVIVVVFAVNVDTVVVVVVVCLIAWVGKFCKCACSPADGYATNCAVLGRLCVRAIQCDSEN